MRLSWDADVWAAGVTLFELLAPFNLRLFQASPMFFVRDSVEQTTAAIRDMALDRARKRLPLDKIAARVLEATLQGPGKRSTLACLTQLLGGENDPLDACSSSSTAAASRT